MKLDSFSRAGARLGQSGIQEPCRDGQQNELWLTGAYVTVVLLRPYQYTPLLSVIRTDNVRP
jgi:hypothetical protein